VSSTFDPTGLRTHLTTPTGPVDLFGECITAHSVPALHFTLTPTPSKPFKPLRLRSNSYQFCYHDGREANILHWPKTSSTNTQLLTLPPPHSSLLVRFLVGKRDLHPTCLDCEPERKRSEPPRQENKNNSSVRTYIPRSVTTSDLRPPVKASFPPLDSMAPVHELSEDGNGNTSECALFA
jgi:hypothetical protein